MPNNRGRNNKGRGEKGRDEQGQFTEGSRAAERAGKKGGETAQERGTAHQLTREERAEGGRNSHQGEE